MAEEYGGMQLINGTGKFNDTEFEKFGKKVKMDKWGDSYTVVSIMGPQSSGKSTLLNHLFDTKFRVMNHAEGRKRTTSGIWVAKSGIGPGTLVMDMEGSDSSERGENGTVFENWSALFALATSNIVLINLWCHDIGREHAANKPLLRTIFQFIQCGPLKVTLMFILRDQTKTPLNVLKDQILEDMKKIWDSIGSGKQLEEFFDVKVEALCNYEEKPEQFKKEALMLKKKICGVNRDQSNVVPASSFPSKAKEIWKQIRDIKVLNIPSIQVLRDRFHCDEIAKEKFEHFKRDYKAKKRSGMLFSTLLETCLSEYDRGTLPCDKVVKSEKREELKAKLLRLQGRDKAKVVKLAAAGAKATINIAGFANAVSLPEMQGAAVSMIPGVVDSVSDFVDVLLTLKEKTGSI